MGQRISGARIANRINGAASGDQHDLYELGVAYSTGADGAEIDLIEAHKWFNLAALRGNSAAQASRAELAGYMNAREIAEAQRQARAWLGATIRRAA